MMIRPRVYLAHSINLNHWSGQFRLVFEFSLLGEEVLPQSQSLAFQVAVEEEAPRLVLYAALLVLLLQMKMTVEMLVLFELVAFLVALELELL